MVAADAECEGVCRPVFPRDLVQRNPDSRVSEYSHGPPVGFTLNPNDGPGALQV
jgi:hypothetical protein